MTLDTFYYFCTSQLWSAELLTEVRESDGHRHGMSDTVGALPQPPYAHLLGRLAVVVQSIINVCEWLPVSSVLMRR